MEKLTTFKVAVDQIVKTLKPPTTKKNNKIPWDTLYSSYYWNIYLDPLHSRNSPNVPCIPGYSKVQNQHENSDANELLRRKIAMLFNNGYMTRSKRIEIFQRKSFMVNKKQDPKILILYPTYFDIPELQMDWMFKVHGVWLKQFYSDYLANRSTEHLFPKGKKMVSNDQFLNIHNFSFNGLEQLYSHAARLLTFGHPEGMVTDFIRKYKELKQWK